MVLRLRRPAPGGWEKAKCRGLEVTRDYDPFFSDDPAEAVGYCNGIWDGRQCPLRDECLIFALTNNCKDGVWGGASELTRRALRRRWPLIGKEPRKEWRWMTEQEALEGLDPLTLEAEEDEEFP